MIAAPQTARPPTWHPARVPLGRLLIDPVTLEVALGRIEQLVMRGHGGAVYTPNVDHLVRAERDREFCRAYAEADLCLADGTPLLWACRLLKRALPEKVSGSDLVQPLLRRAAGLGWRVYLLGGAPGVAADAASLLTGQGVNIVGHDAPRIALEGPDDETPAALQRIRRAAPDLLLVALGAPKQEVWIHRHALALGPAVSVGVGASLDFLVGRVRRAPRWMSRAGLEWLFRLAQEPRRLWRRYLLDDPAFLGIVLREWLQARERPRLRA